MLYRPLFWTSYWCEDWLHTSKYRNGASQILISSASSKTAFCLAYLIGKRISRGEIDSKVKIVGLTSKKNLAFTKNLGLYHDVLDYNSFSSAKQLNGSRDSRWIYVDVAGNDDLNKRIFAHFASPYTGKLAAWIALGMTNLSPSSSNASSIDWNANTFAQPASPSSASDSAGSSTSSFWPVLEQFFMPEWLDVRKHQLSIAEIFARQNVAWKELMADCGGWVRLTRVYGAEKVQEAYGYVAKEGLGPDRGLIWSLWDEELDEKALAKL